MGSIVPSSLATGGSGVTYEQRVGAMFLSYLLTRNPSQVFPDYQVEEVGFQTGHGDWRTDDILVVCSAGGRRRKIAIQAKLTFVVGNNPNCIGVFRRLWEDFDAGDRFDSDKDALVTSLNTPNLDSLARLLDCARDSADAEDFKSRLEAPGFVQKEVDGHYRTIRDILKGVDAAHDLNDEKIWRFLRALHILFLDFDRPSSQSKVSVMDMLSRSADGTGAADVANATWHELVSVAASSASGARTLRHCDLPEGMRERHRLNSVPMQILSHHTKTTLDGIRTTIAGKVTLPRTGTVAEAATALAGNRVVALTGPAGSGKSVLARRVVEQESGKQLCLSFRAEEFARTHLDQALPGSIPARSLEAIIESEDSILIHLESLERLLESPTRDAFVDLVAMAERHPRVSLLLTCRDDDMSKAADTFFGRGQMGCRTIRMPPLDKEDIMLVAEAVPDLKVPLSRPESGQIVGTPYVLDMAARMAWPDPQDIPSSTRAFRERWWSDMVRGDSKNPSRPARQRERALVDLAMRRARQMRPSVTVKDIDSETLHALRSDGLIVIGDAGLATPAHDVIEDWAVMRYVDLLAAESEWQTHPMAEDLGTSPAVRRGFRGWLREQLDADSAEADRFVLAAYGDGSLPRIFREDVLISVLLSGAVGDFVSRQKDHLLEDDAQLLVEMIRLTRVACTKISNASGDKPARQSIMLEPEGEAWPALLEVIDGNLKRLLPGHYGQILGLLKSWASRAQSPEMPEGSVPAISVAYRLLRMVSAQSDDTRRILEIIAGVPRADSGSFLSLVEWASSKSDWRNITLGKFRDILMGRLGFPACRDFPEEMAGFVRSSCIPEGPDTDRIWTWHEKFSPEFKFGLYPHASSNFPHFSAFRGLFWPLLRFHPGIGVRLVLDLVNHVGDWYGAKGTDAVPRIVVPVPGHAGVIQWADDHLWQAYRGVSETPRVIACALMALEHWLLKMCEHGYDMGPWLLKILRESRNVMTTGVVASVCIAHPDLCGAVPRTLLKSEDCIRLDQSKVKKEWDTPPGRYAAVSREDGHYDEERIKSNVLPHRRRDLESLAHKLRPRSREESPPDGEGGGIGRTAVSDARQTNARHQDRNIPEAENLRSDAPTPLYEWGLKRWRRDSDGNNAESWQRALGRARDGAERRVESDRVHFTDNGPPVVAAVCVRDHWWEMSVGERRWCAGALAAEVGRYSDDRDHGASALALSVDSDSIAARSLPKILADDPDNRNVLEAVARSLTHASPAVCLSSAKGVGEYLQPKHRELALRCAGAVAMLSNLLAGNGQRRPQKGRTPVPDGSEGEQNIPELARRALADGSVDAGAELEDLDLASRRGRDAAVSIMHMLGRAPDLPVTGRFVARVGRAVVDTWVEEYEVFGGPDQEFSINATAGLAEIILSLPRTMINYCRPFLKYKLSPPDDDMRSE